MSYVDRVHSCDQCYLVAHAEDGELLPDGWVRTKGGAVFCSTRCQALAQGRPVPRAELLAEPADPSEAGRQSLSGGAS